MRNWTFGRKVGIGFAVAIIALIVVGIVGYRASVSLIANDERVAHTQQVRRQIQVLLTDLINAETGQRGYVITGKDDFLAPYTAALVDVDRDYLSLRALVADNARQVQRLDQMRTQTDEKLNEM